METLDVIVILVLIISLLCSVGLNLWHVFVNWFTRNYILKEAGKHNGLEEVQSENDKRVNDELVAKIVGDFKKLTQENNVLRQENRTLAEFLDANINSYSKLMGKFLDQAMRIHNLEQQLFSTPIMVGLDKKSYHEIGMGGNLSKDEKLGIVDLEEEEVSLSIDPRVTIEVGTATLTDFEHLGDIMTGHDSKSDIESVMVVAKMEKTVVYDELLNKINGAKSNISNLLARVDDKLHSKDGFTEYEE